MAATPTDVLLNELLPLILVRGFKKRTLRRPSEFYNPMPHPASGNSKQNSQLSQASRNSSNCNHNISARVSLLLFGSGPLAVFFEVTKRIVFSVQGQADWLWSHIGKKVFKPQPLLADPYSSPAITLPCTIPLIRATATHRSPCAIRRRVGASMCEPHRPSRFHVKTTTRPRSSLFEIYVRRYGFVATDASAKTASVPLSGGPYFIRGFRDYRQPSKSLADKIGLTLNRWGRSLVLHDEFVSLCRVSGCWLQRRDISIFTETA